MLKHLLFICGSIGCISNSFSQNVMISNQNEPSEPSIMVDPNQPNRLIAASNINNYYLSDDSGQTWTDHTLSSPFGVWGDPVIDVDNSGAFYFFHLSHPASMGSPGNWIDRIVCQKTDDHGTNWTTGSYTGLNGTKAQDKHWSVIDQTNNNIYITWTQFDSYGSSAPLDSSIILFSKSTDGGESWTQAKRINKFAGDCIDEDDTVEGAVPAVGPNGELYVTWTGPKGIVFNKSLDQGDTWMPEETVIDSMTSGWEYDIPGIMRANGLPILKCDLSGGPNHGTLYINWSDQRNGEDDTDIFFSKSTDGGTSWSPAQRVNDDSAGKHQFFTWMDIDQTNGDLYFVFYDRRAYSDNNTDVFMAISQDGGDSFINRKISESPFIPIESIFFGDYTNVVAHNGVVHPIWTRLHNGQLSIWTNNTPVDQILSTPEQPDLHNLSELKAYPNPVKDIAYVSFKIHKESRVDILLYDTQGKKVTTVMKNEIKSMGKYIIPIYLKDLELPRGTYFTKLLIDGVIKSEYKIVNQ